MWRCGRHSRRREVQGQRPRGGAAPFELGVAPEQGWSGSRALGPPPGPQGCAKEISLSWGALEEPRRVTHPPALGAPSGRRDLSGEMTEDPTF